jgi:hypothetical protein
VLLPQGPLTVPGVPSQQDQPPVQQPPVPAGSRNMTLLDGLELCVEGMKRIKRIEHHTGAQGMPAMREVSMHVGVDAACLATTACKPDCTLLLHVWLGCVS